MGASDEYSHQEGNQVRGQLGITSFPPEILLSCGPAAEGAELGYDRLSPLHTTLEPYAPTLYFAASIAMYIVMNDICYGFTDLADEWSSLKCRNKKNQ